MLHQGKPLAAAGPTKSRSMSLRSGTKFKDNFHRNDFVTNGTRPAPRNNSVISNESVGWKNQSLGNTDPELKNNKPEKVSRKREFQRHRKNSPPPETVLTYEGTQKIKLKAKAQQMHMLMSVHIRTQNPKQPRIQISHTLKHAKMSPLTHIA